MSDFKDIWKQDPGGEELSDEQLMAYLEGKLPEADQHAIEAMLSREGMESDAIEGLQALSPEEILQMKRTANSRLQQTLSKKKRGHKGIPGQQWNLVAVVTVLLLLLACFAVFWLMRKG